MLSLINVKIDSSQLYCNADYSQLLNIKGKNYFIETSVVLISVMLAFNHKKDAIKAI